MNKLLTPLLFVVFILPTSIYVQHPVKDTFNHMGINREYIFFSPDDLSDEAPLVVVLHGYTSSAEKIMKYSGMNDLAIENGFAVVYPQGTKDDSSKTFWNVGYEFHAGNTTDDVGFIVHLIRFLQKKYNLSVENTFVTGMSNGGDMSYLLACRRSEVFAAAAPVAGTMMESYFDCCDPKNPLPLMAVAGTEDPITSFEGDMKNSEGWGSYQSIPFIIEYWAGIIEYNSAQFNFLWSI